MLVGENHKLIIRDLLVTSVIVCFTPARSTMIGAAPSSKPGPPVNTGLSLLLLKILVLKIRFLGLETPSRYGCTYSKLNERSSCEQNQMYISIYGCYQITI